MRFLWKPSNDSKYRLTRIVWTFLPTISLFAGVFVLLTLCLNFLVYAPFNIVPPGYIYRWDKARYGPWKAAALHGTLGRSFDPRRYIRQDFHGWIDPLVTNYTLTISDTPHWPVPDCAARIRELLSEARRERYPELRSSIHDWGTRVTCWEPARYDSVKQVRVDGGFYSRHVSPVELDWLNLPRFQDTYRASNIEAEARFCQKFKRLAPFYYGNSSWYGEIVEFDRDHFAARGWGCQGVVNARTAYPHPLCEPGYKTIPGGCGSDPPSMDLLGCFKTANFVGWKNEGGKERMFVLEQWRDCWGNAEYGGVVGKIMNAFSMEERVEAIIMMGGKEVDEVEFFRDWNSGGKGNGFEAEGLC